MLAVLVAVLASAGAGGCRPDDDVSRELGAACTTNTDCDQLCLAGMSWPGGLCSRVCEADDDCPDGAVCAEDESRGLVCVYACLDDGDCAFLDPDDVAPYTCQELPGPGADTTRLVCRGAP